MSPRSAEFLDAARRRIEAAKAVLDTDPSTALSAAYYAMLYGARAALSEHGVHPKTHRGTWHEFRRTFVDTSDFDVDLASAAQNIQPDREQADYDAWSASEAEAGRAIKLAEAFLDEIEATLD